MLDKLNQCDEQMAQNLEDQKLQSQKIIQLEQFLRIKDELIEQLQTSQQENEKIKQLEMVDLNSRYEILSEKVLQIQSEREELMKALRFQKEDISRELDRTKLHRLIEEQDSRNQ